MDARFTVGVVHKHPLVRWALRELLTRESYIDVQAITDVPLPELSSLDAVLTDRPLNVRRWSISSATKVLMLSDSGCCADCAFPLIGAQAGPEEIADAVRVALLGSEQRADVAPGSLSPREEEVLGCIASGLTHGQIARRLKISQHTVDTYVKRIRGKLGVGNKAQLTQVAMSRLLRVT